MHLTQVVQSFFFTIFTSISTMLIDGREYDPSFRTLNFQRLAVSPKSEDPDEKRLSSI